MAKPMRIKTTAAPYPVPQTREQVVEAIAEIGRRQRERDRISAAMNDELSSIRQRYEEEARPHADAIRMLSGGVHVWCEANRDDLTRGGKVKHANLASGEVKWRTRPPRVVLRCIDNIIETCKKLGLARFIRTKEEINKEALLAEQDVATGIQGVSISQGEDFVIVPYETALEEVA
ncbi:MAG: host-nuclease inhibitor Gam family protein [Thermodesulfobacteriota bacterium]